RAGGSACPPTTPASTDRHSIGGVRQVWSVRSSHSEGAHLWSGAGLSTCIVHAGRFHPPKVAQRPGHLTATTSEQHAVGSVQFTQLDHAARDLVTQLTLLHFPQRKQLGLGRYQQRIDVMTEQRLTLGLQCLLQCVQRHRYRSLHRRGSHFSNASSNASKREAICWGSTW